MYRIFVSFTENDFLCNHLNEGVIMEWLSMSLIYHKYQLIHYNVQNKTGTSQVGAISKAQKAQIIFFGKKLEIFEKNFHSENVA